MATTKTTTITVEAIIIAPVEKVWNLWTGSEHITKWNNVSDDWHTPWAENDLRIGGRFVSRMEAKDGSSAFDFAGVYDDVKTNDLIAYTIDDGRKVRITFTGNNYVTEVSETFETESTHPIEMQRKGWQAIMNSFKKYVEST